MRMIDKAGGELGKAITHPLQREFERSLTRVLGSKENWQAGYKITMDEFNNISNKEFVRSRLEALGFVLGRNVTTYEYVGEVAPYKPTNPVKKIVSQKPVFKLKPNRTYGWVQLKEMLEDGLRLSTERLTAKDKRLITTAVSKLRKAQKMDIESEKVRDGVMTLWVTYYLI